MTANTGNNFEINLRRMSTLAYALSLWKTREMQLKLRQFYYPYGRSGKMKFLEDLIDEVIKKIDPALLPVAVYSELIETVRNTAFKMYNWFNFIRRRKIFRDQSRRQIYDKYCKDIYWTHYGTLDEVKILKSWVNNPDVDLIKVYVMACCFCVEELIAELWEIVGKGQFIPYNMLCSRDGFHLVAYWNKLRENNLLEFKNDCIVPFSVTDNVYDPSQSVKVNMLRLSVKKGYALAVKYFWNKLNMQERNENIKWLVTFSLDAYYERMITEVYKEDQYAQIVFYLFHFMSEPLKKEVFTEMDSDSLIADWEHPYLKIVLKMSINMWPWQELFRFLFKNLNSFFSNGVYKSVVENVINHSARQKNPFFLNLLYPIWNTIPRQYKNSVITQFNIATLLEMGNISCMKLILFDDNLATKRVKIMKNLHHQLQTLIRKNDKRILQQFFDEILVPQNLLQDHQRILKSLYKFIMNGEIKMADESINHLSKDEQENLKTKLDSEIMCYYFLINNDFDSADRFLIWKFEDKIKVKKFKTDFMKNDFILNQISHLWKTEKKDVDLAKKNSDKFLVWLLEEEKQILPFKVKKILPAIVESKIDWFEKNTENIYSFTSWHDFIDQNHLDILEDFLKWVYLNDEGIRNFKITFKDQHLLNIIDYFLKIGEFEKIINTCKWIFDSDAEMFDFLAEELMSEEGILSCKLFISRYSDPKIFEPRTKEELKVKFKNFINLLVRPLKNFDNLKLRLKSWPDNSKGHEQINSSRGSSDSDYTDQTDPEEDEYGVYCNVDNYKMFLDLLDEVKMDCEM